jgi:hypothetical protein
MRNGVLAATIAEMSTDAQRLTIEIEPGEPIRGRLVDEAGATHPFHGWLELSATLERVRDPGGRVSTRASDQDRADASTEQSQHPRAEEI